MLASGFTELTRLHEGGQAVVFKARRASDGRPLILKMLRGPYPTPESRSRFRREYELTRQVAGEGVIRVEGWAVENNIPIIVLEDFGGASLDQVYADAPPSLERALELGIAMAEALGRVHAAQVLHLDINPSNIVVSPEGTTLKLIDFGLSTDLPRQNSALRASQVLRGTLRYVAPEQTGRMNRSLDHRSDYYSLGATLYWLVTGRPPFTSEDPLELVHAHIARRPEPPHRVDARVPKALSSVILTLLEKNAEDRYQSVFGLVADLERCLRSVREGAALTDFVPGRDDRRSVLAIPERLYGRDAELAALLAAFDRVRRGAREVAFVHGGSGMGKTALVREAQRPLLAQGAAFVAGKFAQFKRDVPYASLTEALRQFVRLLLTGQQGEVARWMSRIDQAVSPNGRLLTDLIPELELILGEQPPVPELPAIEAESRLHLTVRRFMRVLATAEHPLVLFMDDLQWADLPSLGLLKVLATDPGGSHVLMIGAFRNNEVGAGHPLRALMAELGEAGVPILHVTVGSLDASHVGQLLADTLQRRGDDVDALAASCVDKTGGNPFFLHRFLRSLVRSELVAFDAGAGAWRWDPAAVAALEVTSNVVQFLADRFDLLPEAARRQLEAASVVGDTFEATMLAAAQGRDLERVLADLKAPLREGLIEEIPGVEDPELGEIDRRFRFSHDRIQQAAYERTTPEVRRTLHGRVGRRLLDRAKGRDPGEALFDIVNHLNAGLAEDAPYAERVQLAELNLSAARRALLASAYDPAARCLARGRALLGPEGWQSDYDLMRDLTQSAARAAYLTTDFERAEALVDESFARARSAVERARTLIVRIDSLIAQNLNAPALAVGLQALDLLGVQLPEDPSLDEVGATIGETLALIEGVDLAALPEQPPPDDPRIRQAMELVCILAPPAYFVKPLVVPLLGAELVRLTVEHGPTAESSYGFSLLGLVLCNGGHIEAGYGFGQLATSLAASFEDKRLRVRSGHVTYGFSRHWKEPIASIMPDYAALFELAMDVGDYEYAGYIGMMHTIFGFYAAPELERVISSGRFYKAALEEVQQEQSLVIQGAMLQALLNLSGQGQGDDPALLVGQAYDESVMLPMLIERGDAATLFVLPCIKGVIAGFLGQWERAHELLATARSHIDGAAGIVHLVYLEQWGALAALGLLQSLEGEAREARREALMGLVEGALAKLDGWASHNDAANAHRPVLVRAALARLEGDAPAALLGFERAAGLARARNVPMDEGVAHRLAGEMSLEAGLTTAARAHLVEACYAWDRWGARALRTHLEEAYPALLGDLGRPGAGHSVTTTASTTGSPDIDVTAAVRASQTIAKEVELERVIHTVVRLTIEISGAARCLLVRPSEGELHTVTALGTISGRQTTVEHAPRPLAGLGPVGIIEFVGRTRQEVVLDDACRSELFASDPYISANQVQSVLCLPIEQQGRLLEVLYLEHPRTRGVFTQARVALLRVLLAQAAISVENATLIDTLEEKVRARTEQLAIATERALAASEAKTVFVRSMSHELRTPLNAILGYAQLLQDSAQLTRLQREGLQTIHRSGRHLLSLINDILDMSRIEAGRLELALEPMRLRGLAEEVAALCHPSAQDKGVQLRARTAAEVPEWVEADARRLRQILLNLVGNAVKFTDRGEVDVRAALDERGRLSVAVRDTGPGIAADRLEAIFEPFEQTGDATQRAKGTGLGLAIARRIARQMGGDLRVESVLGQGSTFYLELPLREVEPPREAEDLAPPPLDLAPTAAVAQPAPEVLRWPPRAVLDELMHHALDGAFTQIQRIAEDLARTDDLRPFAERLGALARDFDDAGVEGLLADGLEAKSA